jgi:hypothetical protein
LFAKARSVIALIVLAGVGIPVLKANASERRFTYTYESLVLNPGEIEIEPWTTFRIGKDDYFVRIDHRLEFEAGLTRSLQTAFYLNFHATTQQIGDAMESEFEWSGISNEWKYKLKDPVADPVGMALYFEWGASTEELEVEAKVILDKRWTNYLVAFNAVVEPEWEFEIEAGTTEVEAENEVNFEFDLAAAWFASQRTSLGLEMRNHNQYLSGDGYQYSALFLGPVASYAAETWWATLTVLPQVAKLKGSEADEGNDLILSDHEKLEVRLLFGMHL